MLQGYPNLEYIIIDGGSSDNSAAIIEKYSPWLSFWVSEPDRGQCHAINKGVRRSSGSFIAWLNSDDIYLPGALFSAVWAFSERPEVGLIHGICELVDIAGRPIGCRNSAWDFEKLISLSWSYIGQPAVFMRADVLDQVGLLDENLHNALDWELWIRIGLVRRADFIPEPWAKARLYSDAKSIKYADNSLLEHRLILKNYISLESVSANIRDKMMQSLAKLEWKEGERRLRKDDLHMAIKHFVSAFQTKPDIAFRLLSGSFIRALPVSVQRAGTFVKHKIRPR